MTNLTIDEIHEILLEITSCVQKILTDGDVDWIIIAGTMLGAVRHKGFIPWDDDIDIGVFRKDYARSIELLRRNLPQKYKVRSILDCCGIVGEIIKIEDTTTYIEEYGKDGKMVNIGVNIDLFPLDYAKNINNSFFSRNRFINIVSRLNKARLMPDSKITNIISPFIKSLLFLTRRDFLIRFKRYLIPKEGEFIANYYSGWGLREFFRKEIFIRRKSYSFENLTLWGVEDYDSYLGKLYGDYLTPPPENDRHLHINKAFRK